MKKIWNYISNVFLNATRSNFKKMLGLVNYHISALEAEKEDTDILALYNTSKPEIDSYKSNFAMWSGAKGDLAGETMRFNNCLEKLSEKLSSWDVAIQQVYREKTPEYKAIFSKGKKVFYSGTFDQRINELDTLELQLKQYATLATVLTSVKAYNSELKGYKTNKEKNSEKLDKASKQLETSRINVGKTMFRNLGMLIYKFVENPKEIERFFDLELLRTHFSKAEDSGNMGYTILIEPKTIEEAGISFNEKAKFTVFNNSNANVGVYAAATNPATPPTQLLILKPDEEKTTSLAELNGQNCRFLFFVNQDENEEAEIEITLVEE
jgi:hypothetical protein